MAFLEISHTQAHTENLLLSTTGTLFISIKYCQTDTTLKAWKAGLGLETFPRNAVSPHASLWNNLTLPHLYSLPDPKIWAKCGIKLISDLTTSTAIHPFNHLVCHNNVPPSHLCCYTQLSHAFKAQILPNDTQIVQSDLERVTRYECTRKPTSVLCAHLLRVSSPDLSKLHQRWTQDIPGLDSEDWEDMWDFPFKILVSLRDRLIQYKILHRAYITPYRLHKMRTSLSSEC